MIRITYSKDGKSNPDAKSEKLALMLHEYKNNYTTSTNSLITAFRMLIAEGKIPHDEIVFVYEEEELTSNEYGTLNKFPEGFCDVELNLLFRIMNAQRKRVKEKGDN